MGRRFDASGANWIQKFGLRYDLSSRPTTTRNPVWGMHRIYLPKMAPKRNGTTPTDRRQG